MTTVAILKILSKDVLENAELKIYDLLGNKIRIISGINVNEIKFDRKNIAAGTYFYSLENRNKIIAHGKIVVQ